MSKDSQKTFDAQTAKFLAAISESIPDLLADDMQKWIENRKQLKQMLSFGLSSPDMKVKRFDKSATKFPLCDNYIELGDSQFRGECDLFKSYVFDLHYGIEYIAHENRDEIVLRPWLCINQGDLKEDLYVAANHFLRGHSKLGLTFDNGYVFSVMRAQGSLMEAISELERNYVGKMIDYTEKNLGLALSAEDRGDHWMLYLHFLKSGASWFNTDCEVAKRTIQQAKEVSAP